MSALVNVFVNDISVNVPKNFSVLQACESVGVIIPKFCFHERLVVSGNCRICLVEVKKIPKPIASCATPIFPGMKIFTVTPIVIKARESVLEFILKNHPLDCPICDQGGECDLQDQTILFGSDSSRFFEQKRTLFSKKINCSLNTIITRCINCTRCVRFMAYIGSDSSLGVTGRGVFSEIGIFKNSKISSFLVGNIVDLCPVGFLVKKLLCLFCIVCLKFWGLFFVC